MKGGGAERVLSSIANEMKRCGDRVVFMVTDQHLCDVVRGDLDKDIELISLPDIQKRPSVWQKIKYGIMSITSRCTCALIEAIKKPVGSRCAYDSFMWQHYLQVDTLHEWLKNEPSMSVIAFLQPTIPIAVLAARGLDNKLVISERADPQRIMKSRYGYAFVEKYYSRADRVVFQTHFAMEKYPKNISEKGVVIPNPVRAGLPEAFCGERTKRIVNFCRISYQKNLALLIEAFALFYKEHSEYRLEIIGDAYTEKEMQLKRDLICLAKTLGVEKSVVFLPFTERVHTYINDAQMFVSSSDYEGMSNSMLEAMAMGIPTICTDCPAGGAAAVIKNYENGILTPVGDKQALADAMSHLADDKDLAQKLSSGGHMLGQRLALRDIAQRWRECVFENGR